MARRIPSPRRLRFETETRRGDPPARYPGPASIFRPVAPVRPPPRPPAVAYLPPIDPRPRPRPPPGRISASAETIVPVFFFFFSSSFSARGSVVAADGFPAPHREFVLFALDARVRGRAATADGRGRAHALVVRRIRRRGLALHAIPPRVVNAKPAILNHLPATAPGASGRSTRRHTTATRATGRVPVRFTVRIVVDVVATGGDARAVRFPVVLVATRRAGVPSPPRPSVPSREGSPPPPAPPPGVAW